MQEKNRDVVTIAEKQRHVFLLQKVKDNKALSQKEMAELKRLEKKAENKKAKTQSKTKLNDKQEFFCKEYLIDLNATQAAIRAGYSKRTAGSQGERLLKNVEIQKRIQKLKAARSKRTEITADRILVELGRIAFSDITDFINIKGSKVEIKDFIELTAEQTACISEITEYETDQKNRIRFKLYDKLKALELAGRHLSMFTDNLNANVEGDIIHGVLAVPQGIDTKKWLERAQKVKEKQKQQRQENQK